MTYFEDLSAYAYSGFGPSSATNVGWLDSGHHFRAAPSDPKVLTALWEFCRISVAQSRGFHLCPFCLSEEPIWAERNGECLLLGSSEIRVFSAETDAIYAAPNLVYHYVEVHHYEPPVEFRHAVLQGYPPSDERYFAALARYGLQWSWTSKSRPKRFRFSPRGSK